jgi:hypothetical protein
MTALKAIVRNGKIELEVPDGSRSRPESGNKIAASRPWLCSVAMQRLADTSVDQTDAR